MQLPAVLLQGTMNLGLIACCQDGRATKVPAALGRQPDVPVTGSGKFVFCLSGSGQTKSLLHSLMGFHLWHGLFPLFLFD
jgi:hypothetical protein